jgi:hypothetical protein
MPRKLRKIRQKKEPIPQWKLQFLKTGNEPKNWQARRDLNPWDVLAFTHCGEAEEMWRKIKHEVNAVDFPFAAREFNN